MNTDNDLMKFVITLGELFPGNISEVKAKLYVGYLREHIQHANLAEILNTLVGQCQFFPSVKEILDACGARKQTRREMATEFIDTMLALIEGSGDVYAIAGQANARFFQECTGFSVGMAKNDAHSGRLEARFLRGQWIDSAEREYQKHDSKKQLAAKTGIAQITGEHDDTP